MIDLAPTALRGSYPPLVTPFRGGAVDHDAYARLVERQAGSGSHGIVVNGTTAEPSSLTVEERNALVDLAVRTAAGRLPVVAATGSQSLDETLRLTEAATRAGADAVMVVTPYYIRPPQRAIVAYFEEVAKATDRPILMYHIPGRAGVSVTVETLTAIAERVPHFVGMKHAATELALVTEARRALGPAFRIFVGLEELSFPMLCLGAAGLMNAAANLVPREVAALCEAVERGDLAAGQRLHDALWDLNRAIFFDTNPIPLKYMLRRLGVLPANEHRLPMMPPTPEVCARLDAVLAEAGLAPAQGG